MKFTKLFTSRKKRAQRSLCCGEGTYLDPSVQFIGCHRITIGRGCAIGQDSWLNVNDWNAVAPAISIGDFSFIGRRNFFNAGLTIKLGSFCLTGPDCHFLGADHGFEDPMKPYVCSPMKPGGHIILGTNCWLGARVTILKDVEIGHGCVIGAGSMVTQSIPPFSMAFGTPAKVVRRYRPSAKCWIPAEEWTEADEKALLTEEEYQGTLSRTHPWVRLPVVACSSDLGDL